jgi:hypothetical protein
LPGIEDVVDGGTLMSWDGSAEASNGQVPDLDIPEPLPPSPAPPPPQPVSESQGTPTPYEEEEPYDPGAPAPSPGFDDDDHHEDSDVPARSLEPPKGGDPRPPDQLVLRNLLLGMKGYGRFKGIFLGIFIIMMLFIPVAEVNGKIIFFWSLFSGSEAFTDVPAASMTFAKMLFIIAGASAFLTVLFSLFLSSGVLRGFFQVLFAMALPGFILMQAFSDKPYGFNTFGGDLPVLLKDFKILGIVAAFLLLLMACRINIYLPKKWLPRILSFLAGAGLLVYFFVPGLLFDKTSLLDGFIDIADNVGTGSGKQIVLTIVVLAAMAFVPLMGLFALPNLFGVRGMLRSRMVIWMGFFIMLAPLVGVLISAGSLDEKIVPMLAVVRMYFFGIAFLVLFLMGLSAFIGNFLVNMNYNEKMLLSSGD